MKCRCDPQREPNGGRMWSPRRNMATVSFGKSVFVMGGRARSLDDISPEESIGSLSWNKNRNRWREKTELYNDIWRSEDGEKWDLVTPGCDPFSLQSSLIQKNGHHYAFCKNNLDCYGSATCDKTKQSYAAGIQGICVCNMFSPREKFNVIVYPRQPPVAIECPETGHESRMYVFGGFGTRYQQKCGTHACGEGYREFLNDVWVSKKNCTETQRKKDPNGCASSFQCVGDLPCFGEEWSLVTAKAPWRGRGSFGTVVKSSSIFIFAGRGGDIRQSTGDVLFSDVWKWTPGLNGNPTNEGLWELVSNNPGFTPRDSFAFGSLEPCFGVPPSICQDHGLIIMAGGNINIDGTSQGITEEVWTSVNGTQWIMDFSNDTSHFTYVRDDSDMTYTQTTLEEDIKVLKERDFTTIRQVAEMMRDDVLELKTGSNEPDFTYGPESWRNGPMRFICPQKRRAQNIVKQCTVRPTAIDGDVEMGNGEILLIDPLTGEIASSEGEDEAYGAGGFDGCEPPIWGEEDSATRI
jgi:hypothetical protein